MRFVTSSAAWCTQSTELPQGTLQLDTCRLICLEISGKKKKKNGWSAGERNPEVQIGNVPIR